MIVLLAVTSCGAAPPAREPVVAAVVIPDELRTCPVAPGAVPLPPRPRTFDSTIAWAGRVEARREQTWRIATECRDHLTKVSGMVP